MYQHKKTSYTFFDNIKGLFLLEAWNEVDFAFFLDFLWFAWCLRAKRSININ